jgi:hypothetical protein
MPASALLPKFSFLLPDAVWQNNDQSIVLHHPDGIQQVEDLDDWLHGSINQDYQDLRNKVDEWAVVEQRVAFLKVLQCVASAR